VAGHRPLPCVEEPEQRTVVTLEVGPARAPRAERRAVGRFDEHDVGSGVGEQLGAVGTGDPARQAHHTETVEHGPTVILVSWFTLRLPTTLEDSMSDLPTDTV